MSRYSKAPRQILISYTPYERRIAILDDNHLGEILYEHPEDSVVLGSIYKGVVNAVLPGLQAAFVDLGTDKAGFLHVDDVIDRTRKLRNEYDDDDDGDKKNAKKPETIDQLLSVGQEILVQVTKEPIGTKGPRLTSHITLAGRFLVCMPNTNFVGVSKKSREIYRRRELKRMVQRLKGPGVGYIVRTLGLQESEEEFAKQMDILESKWEICKHRADELDGPGLVFRDTSFSEITLREYFTENVGEVWIDDKDEYDSVLEYLQVLSPDKLDKVKYFDKKGSLFDHFGLEEELEKIFESKVYLRRGGYLIIEQTEALVSIDVNTGGKVRGTDQGKNIVETNIDAAWEIAKQLRLRDLGGLVVIDFIDMENEEDIEKVESEFKKAIRQDKAPIHFSLISQFGLMELTRKRVRPNLILNQSDVCPTCQGNRYIPKTNGILAQIDRWLRRCHAKGNYTKLSLALHAKILDEVVAYRGRILKHWERNYKCQIDLYHDEDASLVGFRVFNTDSGDEITQLFLNSYSNEDAAPAPELNLQS